MLNKQQSIEYIKQLDKLKEEEKEIFVSYFDVNKEQTIILNFNDYIICDDKEGHENQNIHIIGKIIRIIMRYETFDNEREVKFIFSLKTFKKMFDIKGISFINFKGNHKITFIRKNQKYYELKKHEVLT